LNYSKIESEFANFSLTVRFVRCLCLKRSVMLPHCILKIWT